MGGSSLGCPGGESRPQQGATGTMVGSGSEGLLTPSGSLAWREVQETMEPSVGITGNAGWWDPNNFASGQAGLKEEGIWNQTGPDRASRDLAQGSQPFQTSTRQRGMVTVLSKTIGLWETRSQEPVSEH